jgi:hypothetical protein
MDGSSHTSVVRLSLRRKVLLPYLNYELGQPLHHISTLHCARLLWRFTSLTPSGAPAIQDEAHARKSPAFQPRCGCRYFRPHPLAGGRPRPRAVARPDRRDRGADPVSVLPTHAVVSLEHQLRGDVLRVEVDVGVELFADADRKRLCAPEK